MTSSVAVAKTPRGAPSCVRATGAGTEVHATRNKQHGGSRCTAAAAGWRLAYARAIVPQNIPDCFGPTIAAALTHLKYEYHLW